MKNPTIVILLLTLLTVSNTVKAQSTVFATNLLTEVLNLSKGDILLEVVELDDAGSGAFPVGSRLKLRTIKEKNKAFIRDEQLLATIYEAVLPNQETLKLDKDVIIKPRSTLERIFMNIVGLFPHSLSITTGDNIIIFDASDDEDQLTAIKDPTL